MEQVLLIQEGEKTIIKSKIFENENELQEIIKQHPNLINLSSIFSSPIMVIGRENEYIDVLAITADAVPVIIECKRKENADMRYLIAQVLEYASKLEQMTYNDFDIMVSNYFNSSRCEETVYKNLSLKEAFKIFIESGEETIEAYEDNSFVNNVSDNLRDGEFYLVVVVDTISDATLRTVNFLNKKLEKLRIDIIEIYKFQKDGHIIFVPKHINDVRGKIKPPPGEISFDEMIKSCGSKEAEYVSQIFNIWTAESNYSIKMGTKGFSARYLNIPVFFVLPNHFRIAPTIKKKYGTLFLELMTTIEKYFTTNLEAGVSFASAGFESKNIESFLNDVKNILTKHSELAS